MSQAQPFAGIRVIEFGQFMAVPFCGHEYCCVSTEWLNGSHGTHR